MNSTLMSGRQRNPFGEFGAFDFGHDHVGNSSAMSGWLSEVPIAAAASPASKTRYPSSAPRAECATAESYSAAALQPACMKRSCQRHTQVFDSGRRMIYWYRRRRHSTGQCQPLDAPKRRTAIPRERGQAAISGLESYRNSRSHPSDSYVSGPREIPVVRFNLYFHSKAWTN